MIETGVFYNRHDAEEAVRLLHELAYRDDEISVIGSDRTGGTLGGIVIGVTPRDEDRGLEPAEFTHEEEIPPRRVIP